MCEMISGAALGPRVVSVIPNDNYELLIMFDNGEQRKFDAKQLLSMKVFSPLKNKAFFNTVKAEFGTIVWPHDIDYCPDTLYAQSVPIDG